MDTLVHLIGTAIEDTPIEEPLDRLYYRVTGPRRVSTSLAGMTAEFAATSSSEYYSAEDLGGESGIVGSFLERLTPDDVVWDVGAFVGWHAAFTGQVAETIAFEADPEAFMKLLETCRLNPEAAVTPVLLGLANPSDGRDTVAITRGEGGGITDGFVDSSRPATTVAKASDLIGNGFSQPTAIKIDVQGVEGEVIDGFEECLGDVRHLLVEFHRGRMSDGWTDEKLNEMILESGFDVSEEVQRREDVLRLYRNER